MLELFETPGGWEVYLDNHYSTQVERDDVGDWLATYRHLADSILMYPLQAVPNA